MNLHAFFDFYVQVLGYFIYIVIALAFLTAYYELKNQNECEKIESVYSKNQESTRKPNVPSRNP